MFDKNRMAYNYHEPVVFLTFSQLSYINYDFSIIEFVLQATQQIAAMSGYKICLS